MGDAANKPVPESPESRLDWHPPVGASLWQEDFPVRSYQVDAGGRLGLAALCRMLQEAAGNHADALGFGVDHLRSAGLTWVLSRMRLCIEEMAGWKDRLQVLTWPAGVQRLFALREFRVTDTRGRRIAAGSSAWLVLDRDRRRPVRSEPMVRGANPPPGGAPPPAVPEVPGAPDYDRWHPFRVRYSDLDINGHANNVSYVEWALEGVSPELRARWTPRELTVAFVGEALAGDRVLSRAAGSPETDGWVRHSIVREADGRELARIRSLWQPAGR